MGVNAAGIGLCVNGLVTAARRRQRIPQAVPCPLPRDPGCLDLRQGPAAGGADGPLLLHEFSDRPRRGRNHRHRGHAGFLLLHVSARTAWSRMPTIWCARPASLPSSSASRRIRLYRANRLERLLRRNSGEIGIDTIQTLLSDHFSAPASICRHPDITLPEPKRVISVAAAAIDLNTALCTSPTARPANRPSRLCRSTRP